VSCAGERERGLPFLWYFMVFYGILWYFMVFYGILWYFMVFYGISNLCEIGDKETERVSTDVRLGE